MKTTWIMETNMGSGSDIAAYVQGVRDSGADVIEVEHIPFSPDLPEAHVDGPVVVYGAVSFISAVQAAGAWSTGVFGTPETFTYEAWAKNYNEMLLNSPDGITLTTIGEFRNDTRDPEEDIFVRPQHDTKSLVGSVNKAGEFKTWCIDVSKGGYAGLDKDTPIIVAQPYGIEAEWRLFVVDNKVVGASQYHKRGRLFKSPGAPQDVLDFAEKVIARWSPVPAYTLDLCRSGGNCYIVEAQGFNSAGHYAADIKTVAEAVNKVAVRLWTEYNSSHKPRI
jgi:ATP-grasp domain, R2K clade family 3